MADGCATRPSDLVARSAATVHHAAHKLSRADDAALVTRPSRPAGEACRAENYEITLSASAGINVYPRRTDADTLLRNADLAPRQAGRQEHLPLLHGRDERARARAHAAARQRRAPSADEFETYLPVLHKDQPPSLEALLRWRHPKLGLVAPASFIAQAGDSGLMLIGRRCAGDAPLRPRSPRRTCAWSSGPSARIQARRKRAPGAVASRSTSRLELDLTEAAVMNEGEETADACCSCAGWASAALDDFGTRYFSIRRIRALGFRRLKIDRSRHQLPAGRRAAQVERLALSAAWASMWRGRRDRAQRAFPSRRLLGAAGLPVELRRRRDVPTFLAKQPR